MKSFRRSTAFALLAFLAGIVACEERPTGLEPVEVPTDAEQVVEQRIDASFERDLEQTLRKLRESLQAVNKRID